MTVTPVADRDVVRSWLAVAAMPFLLPLGFVLGSLLLGDPNDPSSPHGWAGAWRVILLWVVLEVAPVLGIYWGRRAIRADEPRGRSPLIVNALVFAFFVLVTLVGGLADTFD